MHLNVVSLDADESGWLAQCCPYDLKSVRICASKTSRDFLTGGCSKPYDLVH